MATAFADFQLFLCTREDWILRGPRSSSFWCPTKSLPSCDQARPHQRYSVCPLVRIGTPPPHSLYTLPQASVALPPNQRGEANSPGREGKGGGVPIRTTREKAKYSVYSLVRSIEMTSRTQTVPEVRRSKDDRKQNTLALLFTYIQKVQCTGARRRCGRGQGLRAGGRGQEYPQI
jgi:hypothetical protein